MATSLAAPANYWHLKNSGISETIGRPALQQLMNGMETRTLKKGEMLFPREKGVCFLLAGCVGVSRIDASSGKEFILYIVKPGEFFGNSSLHGNGDNARKRNGDRETSVARALQRSRVGFINRGSFNDLMLDDVFREEMERNLESRLVQLETRIEELVFNKVRGRLANLLLRLSRDFSGECPENIGVSINVSLTQNDIACLIAASREITSLTLNDLRRAGVVEFHDRRICIHDVEALKKLSPSM